MEGDDVKLKVRAEKALVVDDAVVGVGIEVDVEVLFDVDVDVDGDEEGSLDEEGGRKVRVRIVRIKAPSWMVRWGKSVAGRGGVNEFGSRRWEGSSPSQEEVDVVVEVEVGLGLLLLFLLLLLSSLWWVVGEPLSTAEASAMVSDKSFNWPAMKGAFCGSPVQAEMSMMSRELLRRVESWES